MRDMLKQHGFMYSTATVDEGNYIINGGTFIGIHHHSFQFNRTDYLLQTMENNVIARY